MRVEEPIDGTLVLTYDSSPLTKFMLGFMVLFLGTAAYNVFLGTRGTDRLIGFAWRGGDVPVGVSRISRDRMV